MLQTHLNQAPTCCSLLSPGNVAGGRASPGLSPSAFPQEKVVAWASVAPWALPTSWRDLLLRVKGRLQETKPQSHCHGDVNSS